MIRWLCVLGLLLTVAAVPAQASPDIAHWRTDNGADVYFVRTTTLPIVDVRLLFDAGAARDDELAGLAQMTNSLLLEGTEKRSAGEIARGFERQGARVSTGSARDMAWVELRSLSDPERLEPVIDLLARVLAEPAFPTDAVERVRGQMLVSLRYDEQSPGALAGEAFFQAVFGDHPYGNPPDGTMEGVRAITREDLRRFHQRYYVARNADIAIVGDISRERAEAIAERLSKALPSGQPAPALPPVPKLDSPQTVRIPFNAEQVHVMIGQPSVGRGHPDRLPLYVANHVLGGGGLVSRLSSAMREERGLSYSTYSSVSPAAAGGWFVMGTQVRSQALDEALQVMRSELREYRREGPTAERLRLAKRNITGSFPLALDSNSDLLGYVGMIGFYGLPLDYLDTFRSRVEALGLERVSEAFRSHVDPDAMVTVLVGPAEAIGAEADAPSGADRKGTEDTKGHKGKNG